MLSRCFCRLLLLFFLFGGMQLTFAQLSKRQKLDSLKAKFQQDSARMYRYKKLKLLAAIDTRNSFVSSGQKVSVDVKGVQIGVVINEHHNLAAGFYSVLGLPEKKVTDESNNQYTLKLQMGYATLFYEYIFLDSKRWEIGIPLEIGGGSYHTTATDSGGKKYAPFKDTLQKGIALFGAGLDVSFKIFKWLGLNAMGGYRLVAGSEPQGMNFNGAFYSVGVQIYFGQLYKMAKFGLKRRTYRHNVEKIKALPD
jgi:hypothetical protein